MGRLTESTTTSRRLGGELQGVPWGADHVLVSSALRVEVSEEDELVTPELALVDPVLAATQRERLPEPQDTLSRLSVWTRPLPLRATVPPKVDPLIVQPNVTASRLASVGRTGVAPIRARRFRLPPTARLVAAVVLSMAIAAVLAERTLGPDAGGPPATIVEEPTRTGSASGSVSPGSAAAKAGRRHKQPAQSSRGRARKPAPPAAQPRRFAWAPIAGSSGYRVELYRGSERIFAGGTTRAQIVIPGTWKSGGRVHRLVPGEYRWYVWPIVDGERAPTAIVQATLTVS
jgi:hypothetical protein